MLIHLDVDTNNDLMHKQGKRYIPGAINIIENIEKLTQHARARGRCIFSLSDAHYGTPSRALIEGADLDKYGCHCIKGTWGALKIAESLLDNRITLCSEKVPPLVLTTLTGYQQIIFEKQAVDGFYTPMNQGGNQNLEDVMEMFQVIGAIVYGMVTCASIKSAVTGCLARHQVHLVTDAIQALDEAAGAQAIEEMIQLGAMPRTTDQVMKELVYL